MSEMINQKAVIEFDNYSNFFTNIEKGILNQIVAKMREIALSEYNEVENKCLDYARNVIEIFDHHGIKGFTPYLLSIDDRINSNGFHHAMVAIKNDESDEYLVIEPQSQTGAACILGKAHHFLEVINPLYKIHFGQEFTLENKPYLSLVKIDLRKP